MQIDYSYLSKGLAHLTGLETRLYRDGQLLERYSNVEFSPDIANICLSEIRSIEDNVFYLETEELLLFGVIRSVTDNIELVIGPTSQVKPNRQDTVQVLIQLGESFSRLSDLEVYFRNMVPYPYENFLSILCFVNYAMNQEKLSVAQLVTSAVSNKPLAADQEVFEEIETPHNTYEHEKRMLSFITAGNVEAVKTFFREPPVGRIGLIAHDELRQRKNAFICAATLMSRAAIEGGLPSQIAFVLSDRYIQKLELLNDGAAITSLNMDMMLDYTKRVEALKIGTEDSVLARKIARFILLHISQKVTIDDLAKALDMNRSYMCEQFKLETGRTINEFIMSIKIEEAKRMLSISPLSIAGISDYLAFTNQSYFHTVFKKFEQCTPKAYRDRVNQ